MHHKYLWRHPDMPVEAFADLWDTIKTGMPWTGMVNKPLQEWRFLLGLCQYHARH